MKIHLFLQYAISVLIVGIFWGILDAIAGKQSDTTEILIVAFILLWANHEEKKK